MAPNQAHDCCHIYWASSKNEWEVLDEHHCLHDPLFYISNDYSKDLWCRGYAIFGLDMLD